MRKNPFRKPDDWDDRREERRRWHETHRKEVKEQFRLLAVEGKAATEGARRAKKIVFEYDDRPESLLQSVIGMSLLCAALFPETRVVASKFVKALAKYRRGDAKTLDEAFGISRPKHWRQSSETFYFMKGMKIAIDVGALLDDGGVTPDVFDEVGKNYSKSGKTIEKIYYRVIDENYERSLAIDEAFEEYRSKQPELMEKSGWTFSSAFIDRFLKKVENK